MPDILPHQNIIQLKKSTKQDNLCNLTNPTKTIPLYNMVHGFMTSAGKTDTLFCQVELPVLLNVVLVRQRKSSRHF